MTPAVLDALPERAASFAAAAAVSWAGTALARRARVLDVPTAGRSSHSVPTPRTGGLGVAVGLGAGWLVAAVAGVPPTLAAGIGAGLFLAVGAWDDARPLPAAAKLLAQVAAATGAVAAGLRLDLGAWGPFPGLALGAFAAAGTVLWVVLVVNVVNFMDGIDGITSATCLVAFAVAAGLGGTAAASTLVPALGAVVGFVPWNVPPARVFLGDGGSHLLGFLVASAACASTGGAGDPAPWPVVLAALVPSFVDVAGALARKARAGVPLAQAHNDHRYQRLVKAGRGHGAVAVRYGALAAALALAFGVVAPRYGVGVGLALAGALLAVHLAQATTATAAVPRIGEDR